jgi:protein phosphatase
MSSPSSPSFGCSPALPRLSASGLSHPGQTRDNNEDAWIADLDAGLFAVADGVGGCAAGEVAAPLAIDTLRKEIGDWFDPGASGVWALAAAVGQANTSVRQAARADRTRAGMATTLTAVLVQDDLATVAHVGDSRAYLFRGGELVQLTDDHTLVGGCIQAGILTQEEAAVSPIRHILARAVGADEEIEVDGFQIGVERGDLLLLSTDGLHGVVDDEAIRRVLLAEPDTAGAAALLVDLANDMGGPDNVTVVLVRIG